MFIEDVFCGKQSLETIKRKACSQGTSNFELWLGDEAWYHSNAKQMKNSNRCNVWEPGEEALPRGMGRISGLH